MLRFVIRLLLTAVAFNWLLPVVDGIHTPGGYGAAVVLSVLFAVVSWVFGRVRSEVSRRLVRATRGWALLVLIPVNLFCFWLVPAILLKLTAYLFPGYLAVDGWGSAILGGLLLMIFQLITSIRVVRTTEE